MDDVAPNGVGLLASACVPGRVGVKRSGRGGEGGNGNENSALGTYAEDDSQESKSGADGDDGASTSDSGSRIQTAADLFDPTTTRQSSGTIGASVGVCCRFPFFKQARVFFQFYLLQLQTLLEQQQQEEEAAATTETARRSMDLAERERRQPCEARDTPETKHTPRRAPCRAALVSGCSIFTKRPRPILC